MPTRLLSVSVCRLSLARFTGWANKQITCLFTTSLASPTYCTYCNVLISLPFTEYIHNFGFTGPLD